MGREAKLGLVFVGILLAVFGGLLMKRLKSPAKTSGMNLFSDSTSKPETPLPVRTQPQPPTLVIARGDNEKPPGTATIQSHDADQRYPIGRTEADNRQAQSSWSRAGDSRDDPPSSSSRNSAPNTPSLLATPLPIPTDGDRYAGKMQNGAADDPFTRTVPAQPVATTDRDLTAYQQTAAPKPYRSAYGAPSDERTNLAAPGNWSGNSTGQVSPDPIAAATPNSPARYP